MLFYFVINIHNEEILTRIVGGDNTPTVTDVPSQGPRPSVHRLQHTQHNVFFCLFFRQQKIVKFPKGSEVGSQLQFQIMFHEMVIPKSDTVMSR